MHINAPNFENLTEEKYQEIIDCYNFYRDTIQHLAETQLLIIKQSINIVTILKDFNIPMCETLLKIVNKQKTHLTIVKSE